jgi:hypothetical protein
MYFLKTGSPAQLQWLRIFEPLMVITGIVQPLATLPSISSCISRTANMPGQSLTTVHLCRRESVVGHVRIAQSEARIYVSSIIGLVMDLLMVNGILINTGWTY